MNENNKNTVLSLCSAYKDYFPIGAAVTVHDLEGTHGKLLSTHFNSLTVENSMKPEEIQSIEGKFNFEENDKIKEFAIKNDMKMRGHTFVWHNQTPDWMFVDKNGNTASKELLLGRLKDHVNAVSNRYKGIIYAWDVVNEAIEDKAGEQMRDTKWLRILGEDYIKYAFEIAKEANSGAALIYNDYNNELPEKLEKSYRMLKGLLEKGTPIDGVGLQAHWNIRDNKLIDNLKRAIEKYASLGLKVQITELDVSMFEFEDKRNDLLVPTAEMLDVQANVYNNIFSVFREYKDIITGVTLWGISDRYTWKDNFPVRNRKDWPLLFDVNGEPKSAFDKIIQF